MSLWRQLTSGLRALFKRNAAEQDISDEIDHYLEQAAVSFEAAGLSPEDARRAAQRELGNMTRVREQMREHGWETVIDTTIADLRYACRRLSSSPGFTLVAVLTLGLGIGASTAIFSAVNPVLFESLPYPGASRIMTIWDGEEERRINVTFGTFREVVQRNHVFESMAVLKPLQVTLTGAAEPERIDGQYVSVDYFRVLGIQPAAGRDFQESDDRYRGPNVVIISDALWHRRFNGDITILGRQITIQDTPVTVVGVLPRGFENVLSPTAEIWVAVQFNPALPVDGPEWGHQLSMVGRLRPGVQPDQAKQELTKIAQTPLPEFPRPQWAALRSGLGASSLQDDLTRTIRPALLAIMGAVILLLTIASVNVTNLLLARGAARAGEFAVRTALGASRWRILRQLLSETLLLAAGGGVLGILLAYAAVQAVAAMSPAELPRVSAIQVDGAVLAFALGLTALIGLLIGVVPALHGLECDLHGAVQRSSTRIAGRRQWTRRTLVVVQVALALVLLVNSGLLLRSVKRLFAEPAGFEAANLLSMQIQTAGRKFRDSNVTHRFFSEALDAVRQIPGVSAAAFTSQLPLTGEADLYGVHFESSPTPSASQNGEAYRYAVSPGYFEVMGIPLKQGRLLNTQDIAGVPLAVVINESFAKRRFPGANPIGQHVRVGPNSGPWFTVVGVVADVKQTALDIQADAAYMTPGQWHFADNARWLVVRSSLDTASLMPSLRSAIWSIDKDQPIVRIATMTERLEASAARRRFALFLFEAFGIVAMFLAAIGTYSLLAGDVVERTDEIGVRCALGASRRSIFTLILRQGMTLTGLGIAFGTVGAMLSSRALVVLLFEVSRLDSITYLGGISLLAGVSALSCAWPAWRAAHLRPYVALLRRD